MIGHDRQLIDIRLIITVKEIDMAEIFILVEPLMNNKHTHHIIHGAVQALTPLIDRYFSIMVFNGAYYTPNAHL